MSFVFNISNLLVAIFVAAVVTAAHTLMQSWLCRMAVRRLHAIQDEMGELCRGTADAKTNRRMDSLANEAARLLARFDIDYWAALERQPNSRDSDRKKRG